jgi:hypothetical protein
MKITIKTQEWEDCANVADVFGLGFGLLRVSSDLDTCEMTIDVHIKEREEVNKLARCLMLLRGMGIKESEEFVYKDIDFDEGGE